MQSKASMSWAGFNLKLHFQEYQTPRSGFGYTKGEYAFSY
jgi:hypothetical protein